MKRVPLISRIDEVKTLAGTISKAELAAHFGVTKGTMGVFYSQHGISLKTEDPVEAATPEQLAFVKENAGKMCQADLAKKAGLGLLTLKKLCSRHGITARFYKAPQRKEKKESTTKNSRQRSEKAILESQLDAASLLLRSHGWTVFRPDHFRSLALQKSAATQQSLGAQQQ